MLEDLEALRAKLVELNARVAQMRAENQQLRLLLVNAEAEAEGLRGRVAGAVQRVDALLTRLPPPAADEAAEPPANARGNAG